MLICFMLHFVLMSVSVVWFKEINSQILLFWFYWHFMILCSAKVSLKWHLKHWLVNNFLNFHVWLGIWLMILKVRFSIPKSIFCSSMFVVTATWLRDPEICEVLFSWVMVEVGCVWALKIGLFVRPGIVQIIRYECKKVKSYKNFLKVGQAETGGWGVGCQGGDQGSEVFQKIFSSL